MPTTTRIFVSNHSREQAAKLGVIVAPSIYTSKKLDVYKNGYLIASIGSRDGADYAKLCHLEKQGKLTKGTAEKRRAQYQKQFGEKATPGSNLWWTIKILW